MEKQAFLCDVRHGVEIILCGANTVPKVKEMIHRVFQDQIQERMDGFFVQRGTSRVSPRFGLFTVNFIFFQNGTFQSRFVPFRGKHIHAYFTFLVCHSRVSEQFRWTF